MTVISVNDSRKIWSGFEKSGDGQKASSLESWDGRITRSQVGSGGERMPYQYAIEDLCAVFNVTETELLGSHVKLRMFAYYRKGKLTATGTLQEIADQTKQKVESLRSLHSKSKKLKPERQTFLVEIEDETRYTIEFTQTFTIEEIERHGLGWLRNSPIAEFKEVE